jgi:tRNA threonylcarbamoyl adenosine modification protein (Sua5/YciO/YrdC/YwlC family)
MLDAAWLLSRSDSALDSDRRWLDASRMQVVIDFSRSINGFPDLTFSPSVTHQRAESVRLLDAAVAKIFQAKGRPSDNPLIVHFADGHAGLRLLAAGGKVPPEATALAEAFWPGPLSICIRANTANVCTTCRAGLDTVAVRVPDHPVALKLLRALDKKMGAATGVAAPSANASGRPSPTEALHVLQDLGHGGKIAGVVDGGRSCSIGIESTVVGDIYYNNFIMFNIIFK